MGLPLHDMYILAAVEDSATKCCAATEWHNASSAPGHERPISDVRPMSAFLGGGSIAKPREVTRRARKRHCNRLPHDQASAVSFLTDALEQVPWKGMLPFAQIGSEDAAGRALHTAESRTLNIKPQSAWVGTR
jgi:hypothetical protein